VDLLADLPAGTKRVNTGPNPRVLYTVYGPPEHAPKALHHSRGRANEALESCVSCLPTVVHSGP
jgi:hypothetical protein